MQKIKRVLTVTTLTKGDETIHKIGNFSLKGAMKAGYNISAPQLMECEMSVEDFYRNATVIRPVASDNNEEV